MTMADTVAVMRDGHIEQLGAPAELYDRPATAFVANFLGKSNLIPIDLTGPGTAIVTAVTPGVQIPVAPETIPAGSSEGLRLGIRPEKVHLTSGAADDGRAHLAGEVSDVSFTGVSTDYLVRLDWGQEFTVTQPNDGTARAKLGDRVTMAWDPRQAFVVGVD